MATKNAKSETAYTFKKNLFSQQSRERLFIKICAYAVSDFTFFAVKNT